MNQSTDPVRDLIAEVRLAFEAETTIGRILGRTKDHTAAIHEWVKKLAGHGVLRQLHGETSYSV